jgi:hypothetical protein
MSKTSMFKAITILSGASLSEAINFSEFTYGMVHMPSGWTSANLGFKVSQRLTGEYDVLKDKSGVPLQISTVSTSGAGWYVMPEEVFSMLYVKLWSKATNAGTIADVPQGADRPLVVALKS